MCRCAASTLRIKATFVFCVVIACLTFCLLVAMRYAVADKDLSGRVVSMVWPYEWSQRTDYSSNVFWGAVADWTETEYPVLIEYDPNTATNLAQVVEKLRGLGVKTIGLRPKHTSDGTDKEATDAGICYEVKPPDPNEKYRGNSVEAKLERMNRDYTNSEWSVYLVQETWRHRYHNYPAQPYLLTCTTPLLFFQIDDVRQVQKGAKWIFKRIDEPSRTALYLRIDDNPEVIKRNLKAFSKEEALAFCRFIQTLMAREKFPYDCIVRDSWTGRERFVIPKKGKGEIVVSEVSG